MNKLALCTALSACLLVPWNALARSPGYYGLSASRRVVADSENDRTQKVQLAIVVTRELGKDGLPLTFYSEVDTSRGFRGRVTHKVSIYRGEKKIWTKKRSVRFEDLDFTSDSMNSFCDAYDKGLEAGDIVVFDFNLSGLPMKVLRIADLRAQLGPRQAWNGKYGHWYYLDCP